MYLAVSRARVHCNIIIVYDVESETRPLAEYLHDLMKPYVIANVNHILVRIIGKEELEYRSRLARFTDFT